jgi:hypothetical protein
VLYEDVRENIESLWPDCALQTNRSAPEVMGTHRLFHLQPLDAPSGGKPPPSLRVGPRTTSVTVGRNPIVIAMDPKFCLGLKQSLEPRRDCFVGSLPLYLLAVTKTG